MIHHTSRTVLRIRSRRAMLAAYNEQANLTGDPAIRAAVWNAVTRMQAMVAGGAYRPTAAPGSEGAAA